MQKLEELMAEYIEINKKIKALKEKKENTKALILIDIKTNDITRHQSEGKLLTFKQMHRSSLNKDKLTQYLTENTDKNIEDFKETSNFEMLRIVEVE